jgi:hypothetical protein
LNRIKMLSRTGRDPLPLLIWKSLFLANLLQLSKITHTNIPIS